ncbi:MAG TPA: STAS domain-containing protein [bacterium]|nr:STAS domain-containing protein [bacterium]
MNDLFILKYSKNNEIRIEILADSINMDNSFLLECGIGGLATKPFDLTLDMKNVKEITSSGIGVLLNIYQNSGEENENSEEKNWRIINVNEKIIKILAIMNLDNILPIVRDEKF